MTAFTLTKRRIERTRARPPRRARERPGHRATWGAHADRIPYRGARPRHRLATRRISRPPCDALISHTVARWSQSAKALPSLRAMAKDPPAARGGAGRAARGRDRTSLRAAV